MVTYSSALQVRRQYRKAMGPALGPLFYALVNDCHWLHQKWTQYVELYGKTEERLDLLDASAPFFFRIVQDGLWADVLIGLCRITDPASSPGRPPRSNLTLNTLQNSITEKGLARSTKARVRKAQAKTRFARDWRNRYLAHADLQYSLTPRTRPLAKASRLKVKLALGAITEVLNHVQQHYLNSTTHYMISAHPQDAVALLYIIRDGLNYEAARQQRAEAGEMLPEDLVPLQAL